MGTKFIPAKAKLQFSSFVHTWSSDVMVTRYLSFKSTLEMEKKNKVDFLPSEVEKAGD